MEFTELLKQRQSIRRYRPGDVPAADIEKLIEAARLAPSAKNLQNWHFIAIKNRALIGRIADAVRDANENISAKLDEKDPERGARFRKFAKNFTLFFTEAPLLIVVMSQWYEPSGYAESRAIGLDPSYLSDEKNPGMQSLGAALEHMTLRAIELGYGSCWLTSANYADDGIEALMREEAGFDREGWFLAALLSVGLPEADQKSPPKKAAAEIWTLIE